MSARPTILSSAGRWGVASATSAARTANPSIADDAKAGRLSAATTSSAETHPCDSVSARCSGASGATASSTRREPRRPRSSLRRNRDRAPWGGTIDHGAQSIGASARHPSASSAESEMEDRPLSLTTQYHFRAASSSAAAAAGLAVRRCVFGGRPGSAVRRCLGLVGADRSASPTRWSAKCRTAQPALRCCSRNSRLWIDRLNGGPGLRRVRFDPCVPHLRHRSSPSRLPSVPRPPSSYATVTSMPFLAVQSAPLVHRRCDAEPQLRSSPSASFSAVRRARRRSSLSDGVERGGPEVASLVLTSTAWRAVESSVPTGNLAVLPRRTSSFVGRRRSALRDARSPPAASTSTSCTRAGRTPIVGAASKSLTP